MSAVVVGSNLTPVQTALGREFGVAVQKLERLMYQLVGSFDSLSENSHKLFIKEGAPSSDTAADSPGSDMCLVLDTTNNDLYLIHHWKSSSSFTATKIAG